MVPKRSVDETLQELKQRFLMHRRPVLASAGTFVLLFFVGLWALTAGLPDREELRTLGEMPQATTLYDVHNRPVFTIFKEYRIEVPLARVSPHLRKAIVAFEDQRFADHSGIDVIRIVGAVWADIREGRKAQGGSTLTQQLARQSFLTREKKLWRKVREIALARRIERMYSKDEILELYLNKIYFGDGLYGAEAASRGYFGKSAADLDLGEAALLAGLVNAPSVNAPTVSMSRALARRALVLNTMREQGIITQEAFDRASKEKISLVDTLRREEPLGQYFKEEVRQQLVKQFGWERLSEGGLKVYTTIDPAMQRAAEAQVAKALEQIRNAAREKESGADRRAIRGRARRDGSDHGRSPRDGRRARLQEQPLQSRDAGAPSAGLGVQAIRVRCCARGGLFPRVARDASRRADSDAAGRVDSGRRAL